MEGGRERKRERERAINSILHNIYIHVYNIM